MGPLAIALLSQAAGMGVEAFSNLKTKKAEKDLLKADLARLQSGQLGLKPEEIAQMTADAQAAAGAQAASLSADVERQSLAGGSGPQMTGQIAKLIKNIAGSAGGAAAKPIAQANVFSKELAEAQKQEIYGRLGGFNAQKGAQAQNLAGNVVDFGQTAAMGKENYQKMLANLGSETLKNS